MPSLTVKQSSPQTALDLLGYDENSIALAIASGPPPKSPLLA